MKFTKYLAKTFLLFAASGAGTAAGVGVVAIGVTAVLMRQSKPLTDFIKDGPQDEDPKQVKIPEELMEQARKGETIYFKPSDGIQRKYVPAEETK